MGIEAISWNEEAIERRFHEHLRLSGRSIAEHDFLSNLIVGDSKEGAPWLFIHTYLDGLRSCHNVGSIVRTTESFRLGPIHLSCDMMACDHPQIKKTSMGAFDHVTISHGTDLRTLPKPWIAIETVRGAPAYNEMLYPESCTLVLGNEERGIQASLLKECDFVVTIPLAGRKNSLNVANAFAIVASEVALQRRQ